VESCATGASAQRQSVGVLVSIHSVKTAHKRRKRELRGVDQVEASTASRQTVLEEVKLSQLPARTWEDYDAMQ
jgi:hypothetical protein